MLLYKFVSDEFKTKNATRWAVGVKNEAQGLGNALCTDGVLHGYEHPLLAVFLKSQHVEDEFKILIEVDSSEIVARDGLKVGSKRQQMIRQIDAPDITVKQRIEIAKRISGEATSEAYSKKSVQYSKYAAEHARYSAEYARYSAEYAAEDAEYSSEYSAADAAVSAKYAAKCFKSKKLFSKKLLEIIIEVNGNK
jgi:hypothetical protein